jgi:hypothetical protein
MGSKVGEERMDRAAGIADAAQGMDGMMPTAATPRDVGTFLAALHGKLGSSKNSGWPAKKAVLRSAAGEVMAGKKGEVGKSGTMPGDGGAEEIAANWAPTAGLGNHPGQEPAKSAHGFVGTRVSELGFCEKVGASFQKEKDRAAAGRTVFFPSLGARQTSSLAATPADTSRPPGLEDGAVAQGIAAKSCHAPAVDGDKFVPDPTALPDRTDSSEFRSMRHPVPTIAVEDVHPLAAVEEERAGLDDLYLGISLVEESPMAEDRRTTTRRRSQLPSTRSAEEALAGDVPPVAFVPYNVAPIPVAPPRAAETMVQLAKDMVREILIGEATFGGKSEIRMQLQESVLAGAEVMIVRDGESLRVVFHVADGQMANLISQNQTVLRDALLEERFQLTDVQIATWQDGTAGGEQGQGRSRGQRDAYEEWRMAEEDGRSA